MARNSYPHIFINKPTETIDYIPPGGGNPPKIPSRNYLNHGQFLKRKFEEIRKKAREQNEQLKAAGFPGRSGIYIQFQSQAEYDLVTKSLEDIRQGIRLLNVRYDEEQKITQAIVYIPYDKVSCFLKKIEDYLNETTQSGNPKNQPLIESIENINLAVLESFWLDNKNLIPQGNNSVKCEAWLRVDSEDASIVEQEFSTRCSELKIRFFQEQKKQLAFGLNKKI